MNDTRTVTVEHVASFPEPLKAKKSDVLATTEKETRFKGWTWCVPINGPAGWIPDPLIRKTSDTEAVLLEDYDATELDVVIGDRFEVIRVLAEWAWGKHEDGRIGWVPLECLSK